MGLFLLLGLVAFLVYSAFSMGYVTYMFYGWFILPQFPTLPHVTITAFIGISFFIRCFTGVATGRIKKEYRDTNAETVSMFLTPWIILTIGYLFHVTFVN